MPSVIHLFDRPWKQLAAAALVAGAVVLAVSTFAAGEAVVATYEAETFSLPSGGSVYGDGTASGGQAAVLTTNGTATKQVSTPAATRIEVRAKGDACKGSPQVALSIDGTQVMTAGVGSSWSTYSVTRNLSAGTHTIGLAFPNDRSHGRCSRSLRLDKVTLYAATAEPAPNPSAPTGTAVTVNDHTVGTGQNQFEYVGSWLVGGDTQAYNGDEYYSIEPGAYYQVRFAGTQVKVYTTVDPWHGISAISIDGGPETMVDTYAPSRANHALVYTSPQLTNSGHTLKVRVIGSGNPSAQGTYIVADRVEITGSGTVVQPSSTPTPVSAPGSKATTRPVGSPMLSDADAAARVARNGYEPWPQNATANRRVPTASELDSYRANNRDRIAPNTNKVTGQFTGTTDEIIQWAAHKWGVDEDLVRAMAVQESCWRQGVNGDAGQSWGLTQVKANWDPNSYTGWHGTYPLSRYSTAFNADYWGAHFRYYYDGYGTWLRDQGINYNAGDLWGSVGAWFSGGWHDGGAESYISYVQNHLNQRSWAQSQYLTNNCLPSGTPIYDS